MRWRLLAGVFAFSIALAACGGGDGGGNGGPTGTTDGGGNGGPTGTTDGGGKGGGATLTIQGFVFRPSTLPVSGATEITITNNDSAPHTFTLDDGSVDEVIGGGETVTVTVDVSETTGFVCRFHSQMTGRVEVT